MDAVHDQAEQDSAEMRQGIDDTRAAMADKLEALEDRVIGTVQSAQETVQHSIQSAKDTVASVKRTFDINHQVEQHPWRMVGGCFLAGLALGYLAPTGRPRPSIAPAGPAQNSHNGNGTAPPTPPAPPEPPSPFQEEIDMAKGIAIGFVMGLVRDSIKESVPQLAPNIDQLMNGLTTNLGGATIPPRSS
jgi:ElaB/YqjD/DUF883 family membrane-anchored ribosome-binding protein